MGQWYRVIKANKKRGGRKYYYWQQTYRDNGHVKTRNKYIGPVNDTLRLLPYANDIVRATEKTTGRVVVRTFRSFRAAGYALVEPISGIPFLFKSEKWDFEIIKSADPRPPLFFAVGNTFIDRSDGELMTIEKVLHTYGLYVLLGTTGADAKVTEERLLAGYAPTDKTRQAQGMPAIATIVRRLEADLRTVYAAVQHGPIRGENLPPKPSPEETWDGFSGEPLRPYSERLAEWQRKIDGINPQSKIDKVFEIIRAEFELAEPGYRVIPEYAHQHGGMGAYGVPSTFPQWVTERLRRKTVFDQLLPILYPDRIAFLSRSNAHGSRRLMQAILDQVDYLAGIDTTSIREKIMHEYGQSRDGEIT